MDKVTPQIGDIYYRYYDYMSTSGVYINYLTYHVTKVTPKGVWLGIWKDTPWSKHADRWVSNTSRKRYAYPSQKEALISFLARKKRQIYLLSCQRARAIDAQSLGIKLFENLFPKNY